MSLASTVPEIVYLNNISASTGALGSSTINDVDSIGSDLEVPIQDPMLDHLTNIERFTESSGLCVEPFVTAAVC